MAMYEADVIPVCALCDSKDKTKSCKKCGVDYCPHFASRTDLRYCGNCISDFHLKETIMEKVVEHIKGDGSITFSRKYQAKHITLQGTDWLFQLKLIPEMADSEIDESIEYHRANIGIMLQERESRKLERIRKLSGIKVIRERVESQEQREKREAKEAGKSTRTKVKEKNMSPEDVMKAIAASGLKPEDIVAALMGTGRKK